MSKRILVQLVVLSFAGVSLTAMAAGPTADAQGGQAQMESQGKPRQQVMPSIPHRDWHKGQRVPSDYRHYNFIMNDWQSHDLKAPPRGHKWLGVNGDYVLVSTSNWIISDIVSGTP
ncbi:RcnB family protein [Paraburkholderia sp. MMS20-SJTR3]|uniref:RcnB family protein n=1 Tax=Paraburkholderia sejongensis TaxID=2886946 RepID=A0ABS8K4S3_9BURK|nr:RcnB family protein [Paraburkholderia sp. MMS20-SJTR3]MCC8397157.1 RcnB family protein [Paraburkholderia sp. MMS20-SJTR3]